MFLVLARESLRAYSGKAELVEYSLAVPDFEGYSIFLKDQVSECVAVPHVVAKIAWILLYDGIQLTVLLTGQFADAPLARRFP